MLAHLGWQEKVGNYLFHEAFVTYLAVITDSEQDQEF